MYVYVCMCVCRLSPNYCIVLGGEELVSTEFDQLFCHQRGKAPTNHNSLHIHSIHPAHKQVSELVEDLTKRLTKYNIVPQRSVLSK